MFKSHRSPSAISGQPLDAPFAQTGREPRSFAGSALVHAAVAFLILVLPASRPPAPGLAPDIQVPRLVFLVEPGPGGGGGGGGERSPEPPSVQKIQGKDRAALAIQVEKRPEPEPDPDAQEDPPMKQKREVPVVSQTPDDRDEKGLPEGPEKLIESAGPGETNGAGNGSGRGLGPGEGSGLGAGQGGGFGGGAFRIGSGVIAPLLRHQVRPNYTEQALSRKIQGRVLLEVVVLRDGTVGDVRLLQGLDPGLDHKAIEAVRQWLFSPAKLHGEPVDVVAEIQVVFALL